MKALSTKPASKRLPTKSGPKDPSSPKRNKTKAPPPQTLEGYKQIYIRRLNDLHVGTQITIQALRLRQENIGREDKTSAFYHFVVPSGGEKETARIRRNPAQMREMLERLVEQGERSKSLLMAISITEDFILNSLKLVLRAHPDRINRGIKGGEAETAVKLEEVLTKGRDEILEERVQSRLLRALHASPAEYIKYLVAVLELKLNPDAISRFIEAKATRDIIIHANGIANEKYFEKAGELRRADRGQQLSIEQAYFDTCIASMKTLIVGIHGSMHEKYRGDQAVQRCVKRFLA